MRLLYKMLSKDSIEKVKSFYHGRPLVVEGCNGSIGLSILEILKCFEIKPSALLLTTHESLPIFEWHELCSEIVSLRSAAPNFRADRRNVISALGNGLNVIFCAGYGRPANFTTNPAEVVQTNITNLMDYAGYNNLGSFAFMSTSELYSGIDGVATEDSILPTSPQHARAVYIESKRLAEAMVEHLIGKKTNRYASFRVALATPPRMLSNDSRVLADLINKGRKNGVVSLNGGANFVRQYQYGPNCAMKILGAMACGSSTLYNNAGSHILTLGDLAQLIGRILNLPVDINENIHDASAPSTVQIDVQRINKECSYDSSRELPFETYLRKMIGDETSLSKAD